MACGALLAAAGLAGLAVAPGPHAALAFFVASAAGRGAVVTLCNVDTLSRVPRGVVSGAGGVIASVQSLGAIVTNPLLGHAVQHYGYGPALAVLAAWTVPGTIAWLLLPASSAAHDWRGPRWPEKSLAPDRRPRRTSPRPANERRERSADDSPAPRQARDSTFGFLNDTAHRAPRLPR